MDAKAALKEVARKHGVSEKEVRREIQVGIDEARKSTDPKVQKYWRTFPSKGEYPTVEEVITHLAKQVDDRLN